MTAACSLYQSAEAMDRVARAERPLATALALYLQDLEHAAMIRVLEETKNRGGTVLSLVFDGLYVAAESAEDARALFDEVAGVIWAELGTRLALKSMTGSVPATFSPGHQRGASQGHADESRCKRSRDVTLTQDLEASLPSDLAQPGERPLDDW